MSFYKIMSVCLAGVAIVAVCVVVGKTEALKSDRLAECKWGKMYQERGLKCWAMNYCAQFDCIPNHWSDCEPLTGMDGYYVKTVDKIAIGTCAVGEEVDHCNFCSGILCCELHQWFNNKFLGDCVLGCNWVEGVFSGPNNCL